ncbi:glycosyltransferase family 2 protein [Sphingobacterium yanglingense]|uniref:Glycosyltransferase involved in cell wall biosynthesis n=1 Tax=Sphingobacterium yanglingense TaxID=1437280 RepID=A0A4R6WHJ6_9SPHI|nr:glycosyltransferase family 2 protein [Sphingobacterium yanglingense]TDQ77986.1 glycosyltransferase involved in cell wall biosynthesis [Sphingobacterium yanglingense]
MNRSVDVSVIVPVYNAAHTIIRCADSLVKQINVQAIELIFINDNSSDDSLQLLEDYFNKIDKTAVKFKIVNHVINKGAAAARNTGLDHASGNYIGWLDADDWAAENMFFELFRGTEGQMNDLVWCDFYKVFAEGQELGEQNFVEENKAFMRALLTGDMQGMLWNKIIRRSIVTDYNIRFIEGKDLGEDRTFLFKVLFYSKSIKYVSCVLYYYDYSNEGSITRDVNIGRVYEEIDNVEEITRFINSNNISWLTGQEVQEFQFRTKRKLLYSTDIGDFVKWKSIFPSSNKCISTSKLRFRHKILGLLAKNSFFRLIRCWIFLKLLSKDSTN